MKAEVTSLRNRVEALKAGLARAIARLRARAEGSSPSPDPKKAKAKGEFLIDKFDLEWIIAESGKAKLIVNKTHATTKIIIRSGVFGGDSIWLLPAEAEAVGKALTNVDRYFAKMRNAAKDVSEEVVAGNYEVTFRFSQKYGFSIYVKPTGRFAITTLSLERTQAKLFGPHLQKAKAMAAFLNKKVRF